MQKILNLDCPQRRVHECDICHCSKRHSIVSNPSVALVISSCESTCIAIALKTVVPTIYVWGGI